MHNFISYTIFGILTTIVNFVSYYVFYNIFSIPNVLSTVIAWILAVLFAFITNKLWVFDSPSFDSHTLAHEIPTFFGARVATGLLDVAIMYMAVDIMAWPSMFWKCVSNALVIILNYVASKLIIFRKNRKMFYYHSLNDDCGAYYPGFFVITLNQKIDGSIDPATFDDEQFATLVHEYVHYLQDISTLRGMYNFIHVSKLLQLHFNIAATKFGDVITLPLDYQSLHVENLYEEMELYSFYQGYEFYGKKIHHVNCVRREYNELVDEVLNKKMELYDVNIYYDDTNNPFTLGQIAITESMAYAVETEAFGAKKRTNEFPYNACEMVCREICPWILDNKAVFVATMELSLMHYHSGDMFLHIVTHIRKYNLYFNSVREFEKYFTPKTCFLYENMQRKFQEAIECIDFLYPDKTPQAKELFKEARDFERSKLWRGLNSRSKGDLFIAKMLEAENPKQKLFQYMNSFGFPITCDSDYAMYGTKADGNLTTLLAPLALYALFMGQRLIRGKRVEKEEINECSLYLYCKANGVKQCNYDECTKHPWVQADREEVCVLGAYWHMYSLTGKSIRRKR